MIGPDALARITAAREALAAGDREEAGALLADLERELLARTTRAHVCSDCGRRFRFPGELEAHELEAHAWKAERTLQGMALPDQRGQE